MKVGVPRETQSGERRVAATPDFVKKLLKLGFEVLVERDAGLAAGFDDAWYAAAGQTIISYLHPAFNSALVAKLAARKVSALAMDQVPRITRAQKVDALASMGNLSGYRAVIEAVNVMQRPLRGQSTAAPATPGWRTRSSSSRRRGCCTVTRSRRWRRS